MRYLFLFLHYSGITFFIRELFQRREVTILLYHDISPENAQIHFSYLKRKYNIISLQDFVQAKKENAIKRLPKKSLIITLDDGHIGNYQLLPIIKELDVPITIFLCSNIVNTKRKFWFKHNTSKFTLEQLKKMTNIERLVHLAKNNFREDQEFENRTALSNEEILEMSEYVDFQSHSMNHPCLPYCTDQEAEDEISNSKRQLENNFGFSINVFSYPNGDYSNREIDLLKKYGYEVGITCDLWFNSEKTDMYRLKRLDCRDEASIPELDSKVTGIFIFLKRLVFGQNFGYIK